VVACSAGDAAGHAVDRAWSAPGARPEGAALGQGGRRRGEKGRKEKKEKRREKKKGKEKEIGKGKRKLRRKENRKMEKKKALEA
jgi:hypothetical protein